MNYPKVKLQSAFIILITLIMLSCRAYKQDIMFKLDDNFTSSDLSKAVLEIEKNYVIQKKDLISVNVFTNKGERIIDPNFELRVAGNGNQGNSQDGGSFTYLVMEDGTIKLPIIGQVTVDSLTINEAETMLEDAYNVYYKDSFVKLEFQNKRVVVLGATGGQVLPLLNENTSLVEVLAQAGGVDIGAKAHNIRLIRGDLNNPQVYSIDLSTIDGMRSSIITLKPGDVIYIEPWRRVWLEGIKDVAPVLSLVSSILTLALVLQNL